MQNIASGPALFNGYQKFVIAVLSFLQFTIILDFMILSPLGAILMPVMQITPAQFGLVVSAYAFSAGASGILAAGFADRFDRKKLLLVFYTGFLVGTLMCGVAQTYEFLLFARMFTGVFGGVIGSVCFAIITDLFPMEKRGTVMGFVQTSFAASQILGIPIGFYIANKWDWHAPFLFLVVAGLSIGVLIFARLEPIRGHLTQKSDRHPFHHLMATLSDKFYLQAFATTALMATGGYMMMPFGSAFSINNLGINADHLPIVYVATGICSMIAGPLVGRYSDKIGKFRMFCFGSALSIVMVIIYTHLGVTPIGWVILISALMFIGITSRMIPSQALMSGVPTPQMRGAFMSVGSSIQQISGGLASVLAGYIVVAEPSGKLDHFDTLGYVVVVATLLTTFQLWLISRKIAAKLPEKAKV